MAHCSLNCEVESECYRLLLNQHSIPIKVTNQEKVIQPRLSLFKYISITCNDADDVKVMLIVQLETVLITGISKFCIVYPPGQDVVTGAMLSQGPPFWVTFGNLIPSLFCKYFILLKTTESLTIFSIFK